MYGKSISLLLILAACGSGPVPAPEPASPAESTDAVQTSITRAWDEHIVAAGRKEIDGIMRIYAEHISYDDGSNTAQGRAAVEQIESETIASTDIISATHTTDELRVYGERAYELGTVSGRLQPHGEDPVDVTFHFMAMWQRTADGAWRMRAFTGRPGRDDAPGDRMTR